jgi:anion-transporting  ArsA/GET3 family ATPase
MKPQKAKLPHVVVCAGGGGVGKTTTSAALALASATAGNHTLVVTIDPARRLASALGVPRSEALMPVQRAGLTGVLDVLMPDPRRSMGLFIDDLFANEPEAKAHLMGNRLFIGLSDAAAGVHELVAMNLVAQAAAQGRYQVIVIDTAPSRHAIDFVSYPARLASLLGGKTVAWLAGLAERSAQAPAKRGVLSWGASRVESLLSRVTGPNLLADTASLFGDIAKVRGQFVERTRQAGELLTGDQTSYLLVVAPTTAALDDAAYLNKRLRSLGRPVRAVVMNRADVAAPSYLQPLQSQADLPGSLRLTLDALEEERRSRTLMAARAEKTLRASFPRQPIVRLPFLEGLTPSEVAARLALELGPEFQQRWL